MSAPVVVVGVGNPWRGDDGVGAAVAREVAARQLPGVDVVELDGEPARLLEQWADRELAVVVDAVVSGAAPGTVFVGDAVHRGDAGPAPSRAAAGGSHAVGLADAMALGRALGRLPARLVTVGVEAAGFDHVDDLTLDPRVAAAVPEAAELVVREVMGEVLGGERSCA